MLHTILAHLEDVAGLLGDLAPAWQIAIGSLTLLTITLAVLLVWIMWPVVGSSLQDVRLPEPWQDVDRVARDPGPIARLSQPAAKGFARQDWARSDCQQRLRRLQGGRS